MDKHTVGQPSPVIQDEMPGDLYAELAHWTEVLRSVQAAQQASQGGSTGAVPIVAPAAPQPPAPTVPGACGPSVLCGARRGGLVSLPNTSTIRLRDRKRKRR